MTQSRLTDKSKQDIINKIDESYTRAIRSISQHSGGINVGGKIRQAMGDMGENLAKYFANT